MKYYELDLKTFDENGEENGVKTYRMRLTAGNSLALEQKTGKSVLKLIQDISMTTLVKLLEYMNKDADGKFGLKEAMEMYDLLVDNQYSMFNIMYDVIYEVLVHSGFLLKSELEELKEGIQTNKKSLKQQLNK